MNNITGTITGEEATRFPSHSYRKLDKPQKINLHSIDPDRLTLLNYYPRFTTISRTPELRYNYYLDYSITFHQTFNGSVVVSLLLMPNEYTQSKTTRLLNVHTINANLSPTEIEDLVLGQTFG
ncbi:hypothetical protein M0R04_14830 [Candidatus Dojkabacteria bacterium]|jgi:hypothetical protein|nr:hypothetical protein [Candidatus Dojkabacteria bacterium]